jgi:hypothetical protein
MVSNLYSEVVYQVAGGGPPFKTQLGVSSDNFELRPPDSGHEDSLLLAETSSRLFLFAPASTLYGEASPAEPP